MSQFIASLFSLKMDQEGETTLVFKIPASELEQVIKLREKLMTELRVSVE